MLPPAPGLLSTTMVHLFTSVRRLATVRLMMSVPPAGGNGTISLMGFAGYCAAAAVVRAARASPARARRSFTVSPLCRNGSRTDYWAAESSRPFDLSFRLIRMADQLDLRDLRYFEVIA